MLTIFGIPKAFIGHDAMTQMNAIGTWTRLLPTCQIILLGDDAGVAEAAIDLGVEHVPGVATNDFGTPLLSAAFSLAEARASFPLMCYVNADILLLSGFADAVRRVAEERTKFLLVGQRWDLDIESSLPFEQEDWEASLRMHVESEGVLHPPSGSDYFVYPRGSMGTLPDFAVGRGGWDNWMLQRALSLGLDLIDVTACTLVVHQSHGYDHVQEQSGHAWEGPETDRNRELLASQRHLRTLESATYRLTPTGLVAVSRARALARRLGLR